MRPLSRQSSAAGRKRRESACPKRRKPCPLDLVALWLCARTLPGAALVRVSFLVVVGTDASFPVEEAALGQLAALVVEAGAALADLGAFLPREGLAGGDPGLAFV